MALGAITRPTPNPDVTIGNRRWRTRDVVLTTGANYTTGGDTLTPSQVGLRVITQIYVDHAKNATGTSLVIVRYDYAANKLQSYRYDGASAGKAFLEEVAAAVDLSTFTARITFVGF